MKIQFDIKYRPQIESGEYKVETRDGRTVRIVCWDARGSQPIVGLIYDPDLVYDMAEYFYENGRYFRSISSDSAKDLFIVTPEPELSEFESAIAKYRPQSDSQETIQRIAAELLELATEELKKTFVLLHKDDYQTAFDLGKAEALKELPRWKKTKNDMRVIRKCIVNWDGAIISSNFIPKNTYYISPFDLEKLPKED